MECVAVDMQNEEEKSRQEMFTFSAAWDSVQSAKEESTQLQSWFSGSQEPWNIWNIQVCLFFTCWHCTVLLQLNPTDATQYKSSHATKRNSAQPTWIRATPWKKRKSASFILESLPNCHISRAQDIRLTVCGVTRLRYKEGDFLLTTYKCQHNLDSNARLDLYNPMFIVSWIKIVHSD